MKKFLKTVLTLSLCVLSLSCNEEESADDKLAELNGKKIITIGDSLTALCGWQPYLVEDDYGYEEYSVEPVITFVSDSSAYSFESYFNDIDFNDLVNSAEDLGDRYESYLRYLLE